MNEPIIAEKQNIVETNETALLKSVAQIESKLSLSIKLILREFFSEC